MNELSNRELQLAINKVCFSQDFKFFFIYKHHYCPNDMTLVVEGDPRGETQEAKRINKPELYEKYMDGVQFYLGKK